MPRCCMTLDLKDDPKLIAEYRAYHERVWPEVLRSLKAGGWKRKRCLAVPGPCKLSHPCQSHFLPF